MDCNPRCQGMFGGPNGGQWDETFDIAPADDSGYGESLHDSSGYGSSMNSSGGSPPGSPGNLYIFINNN